MISLVRVTVHKQRIMCFQSLLLFEKMMIGAINTFFLQQVHNMSMIAGSPGLVPNGIAVKVPCQNGPL